MRILGLEINKETMFSLMNLVATVTGLKPVSVNGDIGNPNPNAPQPSGSSKTIDSWESSLSQPLKDTKLSLSESPCPGIIQGSLPGCTTPSTAVTQYYDFVKIIKELADIEAPAYPDTTPPKEKIKKDSPKEKVAKEPPKENKTKEKPKAKSVQKGPQKKFPKYILDNPYFEGSDLPHTEEQNQEFIDSQKKDFKAAVKYAEDNILTRPPETWTAESIINDLTKLNQIIAKTCNEHPLSDTKTDEFSKEGYRQQGSISPRPSPNGRSFNLDHPEDCFSILFHSDWEAAVNSGSTATYRQILASGTNFLKWFLKWDPIQGPFADNYLDALDYRVQLVFSGYQLDIQDWRDMYFSKKTLKEWHHDFFENQGSAFKYPDEASKEDLINILRNRHKVRGLFTPQELAAADRVTVFFPLPEELPKLMHEMATQVVKMIREQEEPENIAIYVRHAINHQIHPFGNGNARTASLYMNAILLSYGYPAIPRQEKSDRKKDAKNVQLTNKKERFSLYKQQFQDRLKKQCEKNPNPPGCKKYKTSSSPAWRKNRPHR